ncbi:MAG: molybdenum cofactor biosynthesis protein MoaE [Verrucomicrobiota bacterium]
MIIDIQLTAAPIPENLSPLSPPGAHGAFLEFRGIIRAEEGGQPVPALEYEAYSKMAEREIRRLLESLAALHPCLAARVIHRVGVVPAGEPAVYVGVTSRHRAAAFALLDEFMNRVKQDVPIWKRRVLSPAAAAPPKSDSHASGPPAALLSLDEAMAEIRSRCQPLPAVRAPLADALGRVLRETVCAPEDLPPFDRSARDGYAVLADDPSEVFHVVDTLLAADWKPRALQSGQAVRVATGTALPCGGLRVVMQEQVERDGNRIRILKRDRATHIRLRGEDVKAGQPLAQAGVRLNAGALALLAAAGCVQPLVSPLPRVAHFTTGGEIVPPHQTPEPGQIRDSNSTLIRGLLQNIPCDLEQDHLSEDFETAWRQLDPGHLAQLDLILVSGGASVGDRDFTRPLLERLGFQIIFAQVNVRPGKPLLFGADGARIAFGLPGNPLSHFVCFHFAVALALARMAGGETPPFPRAPLAGKLDDEPCPRETLWPARLEWNAGAPRLRPLAWASSGDLTCLPAANALIRVPPNQGLLPAGAEVDFLPAAAMIFP